MAPPLLDRIRQAGLDAGLAEVRVAGAEPFAETRSHIEIRKMAGLFGRMSFTTATPDVSCDVSRSLPGARSLVTGAYGYWMPEPEPPPSVRFAGRIARFSWTDWYAGVRRGLAAVSEVLEAAGHRTLVLVDDNRLVDRAAATRAGVGWFGNNTCVLHPRLGSWVLLGSLATDADLPADSPSGGTCGTCRRCLPACPTGAFPEPGVLDARRCISYLLQAPGDIPRHLREAVGTRVYGCDDCQDVCPPNQRVARRGPVAVPPPGTDRMEAHADLEWLLSAPGPDIVHRYQRFYIPRRDARYLRRNALVALGNLGDRRSVPLVERFLDQPDVLLRRHAAWALRRLGGAEAEEVLRQAERREQDPSVLEEIMAPMA